MAERSLDARSAIMRAYYDNLAGNLNRTDRHLGRSEPGVRGRSNGMHRPGTPLAIHTCGAPLSGGEDVVRGAPSGASPTGTYLEPLGGRRRCNGRGLGASS